VAGTVNRIDSIYCGSCTTHGTSSQSEVKERSSQIHTVYVSYGTRVRPRIVLHHNPLPAVSIIIRACLRARSRTHVTRASLPIAHLECFLFHNLERERLAVGALAAWVRLLVSVGTSVSVRVGRGGEDKREQFCQQRFATREAAAYDPDRGLDADDNEEDGAMP
jgi:hypothetical protein